MTVADLPEAVLHDIFSRLDVLAVCSAARTCRIFLKMARMYPSIDSFDAVCSLHRWREMIEAGCIRMQANGGWICTLAQEMSS